MSSWSQATVYAVTSDTRLKAVFQPFGFAIVLNVAKQVAPPLCLEPTAEPAGFGGLVARTWLRNIARRQGTENVSARIADRRYPLWVTAMSTFPREL